MVDTNKLKLSLVVLLVLSCIVFLVYVSVSHSNQLEKDGFTVLEKHQTYTLVEKNGHKYIATETGMYGLTWSFEHYPECECHKK